MTNKEIKNIIKENPFFNNLNDRSINQIIKVARFKDLNKGDFIFHRDEPGKVLFIVIDGMVKIHYGMDRTRQKTLALLTQGEFFGEMAILTDSGRSADAEAVEESKVLLIRKNDFLKLLEKNNSFCIELLIEMCHRLETADKQIENLTFRNLPGRVAEQLFFLATKFGRQEQGKTVIDLRLTHSDLADMVGTNRESISKIISQFKAENSIEIKDNFFSIADPDKLSAWR